MTRTSGSRAVSKIKEPSFDAAVTSSTTVVLNGPAGDGIDISISGDTFYLNAMDLATQLCDMDCDFKFSTQQITVSVAVGIDRNGSVVMGNGVIATNAADGFFYIESGGGAPCGTPTAHTGRIPMYYDSTNNNLYIYNSGWKKTTVFS